MTKHKTAKTFDCIELKDKIQERITQEIRNLSAEQEIEYFNSKVKKGSFKELLNSLTVNAL